MVKSFSQTRTALGLVVLALLATLIQPGATAAQSGTSDLYLIVPGQSIGPVNLGMNITEVTQLMGNPKSTQGQPDGSVVYRWYRPNSDDEGIGLLASRTGEVFRIWVWYDTRYRTKEGIRLGSSETEIRAAFGAPTSVEEAEGDRDLEYDAHGIFFSINVDPKYMYYNAVWWIHIYRPNGSLMVPEGQDAGI